MQVLKQHTAHTKKHRYRSLILVMLALNYFSTYCAGNELNNKKSADNTQVLPTVSTAQSVVATGNSGNIADFIGSFHANCENATGTYLQLVLSKKAAAYFIQLSKHPSDEIIVAGTLKPDSAYFLKEANVWSVQDNQGKRYAFIFNKREQEPCAHENCPGYITLINLDYKNILGDNCFNKRDYLFFTSTTAKLNPPPVRKGSYTKEVAALHQYIGSYELDSLENAGKDCKGYLSLTQKNKAYHLQLRFPKLSLAVSGLLQRDTVNFDPDFNIWSLKDKQKQVYAFQFMADQPKQIILLNEDAKLIFERTCVVGKTILFTRIN
ncbi:hypothetical protein [Chitinophaga sp. GbtcB8]|uniref:hypothetical protein n=1 Tax=Chitinophaga sp. GbtcB8 TaxID=2824753 RepID=UPI001C2F22D8|nr:hypothetical protein [Chitinophaga sp. GbtcB8]